MWESSFIIVSLPTFLIRQCPDELRYPVECSGGMGTEVIQMGNG
jgi:hypothetical protein